jgi:STE24 endopeptidase
VLLAAVLVVLVGTVLLGLLTWRWVPAQPVPTVTRADLDRDFTAAEQRRERAFRRWVRPWSLLAVGLDVAVPTVLVLTGAVSDLVAQVGGPWWLDVVLVTTLVLAVTRVLTVPSGVVVRRVSLEEGLAAGTWARWWRDVAVAFGLSWVLACAAMCGWVAAARAWPEAWWVPVAAVAGVLVVVLSFLVPVVFEPLFARFTPMAEGPLRAELLELAAADGVAVRDVLVADASRRTTALNAYVSGLGATRRVVVHDTLLDRGRDGEVRAVVAHELGHVVAHDVRSGTVLGAGGAVVAVAAAYVALSSGTVLGWTHLVDAGDPAVAGVLIAAGAWAGLLSAPVQNAVSRRIERRADQHCLELAADPTAVASMHRSLAVTNLAPLRPPRALHLWFGTHPTSPERIAAAREWAARHGVAEPDALVVED